MRKAPRRSPRRRRAAGRAAFSPMPMKRIGNGMLARDGRHGAALGGAVELGHHEAGEARAQRRTPSPGAPRSAPCWRRSRATSRAARPHRPSPSRASPCGSPPSGAAASAGAPRCRRAPRRCVFARADWIASKITAAESPFSWETTVTSWRAPHSASCSRAAARNVSPAASSTACPARLEEVRELGDRRGLAGAVHPREQDHDGRGWHLRREGSSRAARAAP